MCKVDIRLYSLPVKLHIYQLCLSVCNSEALNIWSSKLVKFMTTTESLIVKSNPGLVCMCVIL